MSSQPTLNVMTCGDVSHGKSTLIHALTGVRTGKQSREIKKNMTIKLGYASCKIFKCLECQAPQCYFTVKQKAGKGRRKKKSLSEDVLCPQNNGNSNSNSNSSTHCPGSLTRGTVILVRHLSFVDVPGHAELMQTMVSATCVSDAALLVVDVSKRCPGRQTDQHVNAINLLGLLNESTVDAEFDAEYRKLMRVMNSASLFPPPPSHSKLIVVQNKVDLVTKQRAATNVDEIRSFLSGYLSDAKKAMRMPIIPVSAQSQLNIDALCMYIVRHLPPFSTKLVSLLLQRKEMTLISPPSPPSSPSPLRIHIIRSFDVNKPRSFCSVSSIDLIHGGVLGGAILSDSVSVGQLIEIRPGRRLPITTRNPFTPSQTKSMSVSRLGKWKLRCGAWRVEPIVAVVRGLQYNGKQVHNAFPGGNVALATNIDPSLAKADLMSGQMVISASDEENVTATHSTESRLYFQYL